MYTKILKLSKIVSIMVVFFTLVSCASCNKNTDSENDTSSESNTEYKPTKNDKFSLINGIGQKLLIGVAVNSYELSSDMKARELIKDQFNSIVAENCMKCEVIHPEENRYDWTEADKFVNFGVENNQYIIGHCLIWHSQLAPWFCVDENGNNVSAEVLKQRMKDHITTIMTRYKGKIKAWDVVNEAVIWTGVYRDSKFYQILGEEFVPYAFKCAHEADPDAELYYTDYQLYLPEKRATILKLVQSIKDYPGAQIDGIGYQCHFYMDKPLISDLQTTIDELAATGCKVMATEFDLSALPMPDDVSGAGIEQASKYKEKYNPYPLSMPDTAQAEWNARIKSIFDVFLANPKTFTRVTVWGLTDKYSWKNNWPIPGRTDYATLFDRNYEPKEFTSTLMKN